MNCYDCGEGLSEDEVTYLGTDDGPQTFCPTCTDMREFEDGSSSNTPDLSDDVDIFDYYRFPN